MSKMSIIRSLNSEISNLNHTDDAEAIKELAHIIGLLAQRLIEIADVSDDEETDMQVSEFEAMMDQRYEDSIDCEGY